MLRHYTIAVLALFLLSGCIKQQPQLPANKDNIIDSTQILMQLANEKLIQAEDSLLQVFVAFEKENYRKSEIGYWFVIEQTSNYNQTQKRKVKYSVFSLNNEFLFTEEKEILVGKKELVAALDHFVLTHPEATHANLIIPWYQAYGVKGKSPEVNAYQSVKIEIFISETE